MIRAVSWLLVFASVSFLGSELLAMLALHFGTGAALVLAACIIGAVCASGTEGAL